MQSSHSLFLTNFELSALPTYPTFEVGLRQREWKAKYAVRDDALLRKLCDSLKNILGDTALSAGSEQDLLATFSP
jgi:hypothetical protein